MELRDSIVIPATPDFVFAALNDPKILRASIPGCETLDRSENNHFNATVMLSVGPIKARFSGQVMLDERDAPRHFSLVGQGTGGVAGFAKGKVHVQLAPTAEGTQLTYVVNAQIGGKLAQLGNRLVLATARRLAASFFEKFSTQIAHEIKLPDLLERKTQ